MLRANLVPKSPEETEARIEEIRKRIRNYREYERDYFDFHPEENKMISALHAHAADDLEFLLNEVDIFRR